MKHTKPAQEYVVGFMFDDSMSNVALIRKQKPEWQAGLLNGIGGKIEEAELPAHAMSREFSEEAGFYVPAADWKNFCSMGGTNNDGQTFHVEFFYCIGKPQKLISMEAKKIEVWQVDLITGCLVKSIGNLPWLVALAIDFGMGSYPPSHVTARYCPPALS